MCPNQKNDDVPSLLPTDPSTGPQATYLTLNGNVYRSYDGIKWELVANADTEATPPQPNWKTVQKEEDDPSGGN